MQKIVKLLLKFDKINYLPAQVAAALLPLQRRAGGGQSGARAGLLRLRLLLLLAGAEPLQLQRGPLLPRLLLARLLGRALRAAAGPLRRHLHRPHLSC